MPDMPSLAAWGFAGFTIAAALTWLSRGYALRTRLIDQPGERRSHAVATPRGGGISVVAVMLLALVVLALRGPPDHLVPVVAATLGLVLVAGIGWIDDHRPLSPWLRLAIHAVAASLLACCVGLLGATPVEIALAFAAALVLTNVWNFMDGIDALAASQAAIVAGAYALLAGSGPVLWLGLAMLAALCGFLPFNWPRARIFLGDVGSGAIGYCLAGLLAVGAMGKGPEHWLLLGLPLLPFLLDASLTLLSRIVRGEAWWEAHVQHAYQSWARQSGSHLRVMLGYGMATLTLAMAMLGVGSLGVTGIMVMYAATLTAGGLAWCQLRRRRADSGPV